MIRIISIIGVAMTIALPTTTSFARGGGGGMHHAAMAGGIHDAAGTNASGTALSSSGTGNPTNGVSLGTSPAIAREDAAVDRQVKGSICHGC